jgi:hypothetical protein
MKTKTSFVESWTVQGKTESAAFASSTFPKFF